MAKLTHTSFLALLTLLGVFLPHYTHADVTINPVANSRSIGTTYQNTTGSPLFVAVTGLDVLSTSDTFHAKVGTTSPPTVPAADCSANGTVNPFCAVTFAVPNGYYYQITRDGTSISISKWTEWPFSDVVATTSVQSVIASYDKGFFFSTTSANYWNTTLPSSFGTTSADYWISTYNKGFFWSTTSATYFDSGDVTTTWSTTSTDYWKTQRTFGIATPTLEELTDVSVTGATAGQVLSWNGFAWANATIASTTGQAITFVYSLGSTMGAFIEQYGTVLVVVLGGLLFAALLYVGLSVLSGIREWWKKNR